MIIYASKYLFKVVRMLAIASASALFAAQPALAADTPKVSLNTSMGEIIVELYPEAAPKTVENFLRYVKSGHYNGTIFHRVIDNFMIQGGGFDKNFKEKPTNKPIQLEARHALEHGLINDAGTIAMARTSDPNSATAQFFINVKDNDFLNHQILPDGDPVTFSYRGNTVTQPRQRALLATAGYTPFGKVISGMDVVEQIKQVETMNVQTLQNVPKTPVVIVSATLLH